MKSIQFNKMSGKIQRLIIQWSRDISGVLWRPQSLGDGVSARESIGKIVGAVLARIPGAHLSAENPSTLRWCESRVAQRVDKIHS